MQTKNIIKNSETMPEKILFFEDKNHFVKLQNNCKSYILQANEIKIMYFETKFKNFKIINNEI